MLKNLTHGCYINYHKCRDMKIQFQTVKSNQFNPVKQQNIVRYSGSVDYQGGDNGLAPKGLTLASFHNVSFGMNSDMRFLLSKTDKLRCAYSRREMISPFEIRTIYAKLAKRPNAQSAINFLTQYEGYMHEIEGCVFDLFKEVQHKGKRDFQDILTEYKPAALERLKEKQRLILTSTDKHIENLSEPVAEQVRAIRDTAIYRIDNGKFGRKMLLTALKDIKASEEDSKRIDRIYRAWYGLPSSSKDIDAFIVQYAEQPHEAIAKRLLSSAVATVEHVQPSSRGGDDDLSNFLLVSARFNNDRDSMPLDEYIDLNRGIDIEKNLQKYINDVIDEINNKKSEFSHKSWYPEAIKKTLARETSRKVNLDINGLRLTKEQNRQNASPQKLSKRYVVSYK